MRKQNCFKEKKKIQKITNAKKEQKNESNEKKINLYNPTQYQSISCISSNSLAGKYIVPSGFSRICANTESVKKSVSS